MGPIILLWCFIISFILERQLNIVVTGSEGLSLLNLSLFLMILYWLWVAFKTKRLFKPSNINKLLVLYIVIVAIGIPLKMVMGELGPVKLVEEIRFFKNWISPILLFFIFYNINNEKSARAILPSLFIFFIITVAITIFQGITGTISTVAAVDVDDVTLRSAGYSEPNQYAGYVALFVPLAFAALIYKKKFFIRAASLAVAGAAVVALMATGSKGGIVSFAAALLTLMVMMPRERQGILGRIVLTVIMLFIVFFSYFLAPANFKELVIARMRIENVNNLQAYTSGRMVLWKNGLVLFMESPIYGHGQNTFKPLMKKRFRMFGNSHNDYLLELVTRGLIGLSVFVAIFISIAKRIRTALLEAKEERLKTLYASYLAGLTGYAVAMFGVNIIDPSFVFWIYTGVVYAIANDTRAKPENVLNKTAVSN